MKMEMTLNQKIDWVKNLLSGEYSLWNRNTFYIPTQDIPANITEHFLEVLQKFEREGLIKKAYLGYAGLFNDEHVPEVFRTIEEDGKIPSVSIEVFEAPKKGEKDPEIAVLKGKYKSKTIELLPTYYIEVDERKWVNDGKMAKGKTGDTQTIQDNFIFNEEGTLYIEDALQNGLRFGRNTGRYKILNELVEMEGKPVKTERLKEIAGKETNEAVRKEVGAIKKRIAKWLGIGNPQENEIIEGTEYNGYKLLLKVVKLD